VASAGFAPCWTPQSRHVGYYQMHRFCFLNGSCEAPFWRLDGSCDTDCSGNTSCTGDTHIDDNTRFVVTTTDCDEVCT
jgi:hypothetical protein